MIAVISGVAVSGVLVAADATLESLQRIVRGQ